MKTTGNKILITGGASGIGLALARKFLSLNNQVIIAGRSQEKLEAARKNFPQLNIFRCDLADAAESEKLVSFIRQQHPDLNILINNASVQYNYEFLKEINPADKIAYEIRSNLMAPILLIGALLPVLQSHKESAIVNVSSGLGLVPKRSAPVYCSTKAGVHIFSKALRYQLEHTAIKVFEVIPPLVNTPMTAGRGKGKISPEQLADEFIRNFAADRYEISIGKTKLLRFIQRISPGLADRILKNN